MNTSSGMLTGPQTRAARTAIPTSEDRAMATHQILLQLSMTTQTHAAVAAFLGWPSKFALEDTQVMEGASLIHQRLTIRQLILLLQFTQWHIQFPKRQFTWPLQQ